MGVDDNLLSSGSQGGSDFPIDSEESDMKDDSNLSGGEIKQPKSLREAVRAEKAKKELSEKSASSAEKSNPARKQMSGLLRSAWTNLLTSWGFTLIWIDIHVLLRQIFGKAMFCKLGEEWTDRPGLAANTTSAGKNSKMLTTVEPMGVAACNLGCLIIVLAIFVIISGVSGLTDILVDLAKEAAMNAAKKAAGL